MPEENPFLKYTKPGWNAPATPDLSEGEENPFLKYTPNYRPPSQKGSFRDAAEQLGMGAAEGVEMMPGVPGSVQHQWDQGWGGMLNRGAARVGAGAYKFFGGDPRKADEFVQFVDKENPLGQPEGTTYMGLPTTTGMLKAGEAVHGTMPEAQTTAGEYGRTIGQFLPLAAENPTEAFRRGFTKGVGKVARDVSTNAVAPGVASETAGKAFEGTDLEGPARFFGGFAGGLGAGIAGHQAGAIRRRVSGVTGSQRWIDEQAAQGLRERSSNPETLADRIASGPDEIVPNSRLTMGQMADDDLMRAGERSYAHAGNDTWNAKFAARRSEQEDARAAHVGSIAGEADPGNVISAVRSRLDELDRHFDDQVNAAQERARTAFPVGEARSPEGVGAALRGHVTDAFEAVRERGRQLWQAIDPQRRMVAPTQALGEAVDTGYGRLSQTAQGGVTPVEREILGDIQRYGGQVPFHELIDLRQKIGAAIGMERRATGMDTPAVQRLTVLMKEGVQKALDDAMSRRVRQDRAAVAAGQMAPDESIDAQIARLNDAWGLTGSRTSARAGESAGSLPGLGAVRPGAGGAGPAGGAGAPAGRGAGMAGMAGASTSGFRPVDAAARARYRAALAASRDKHERFTDPANIRAVVGKGAGGRPLTPDSAVPEKIWTRGNRGGQHLDAYLNATGGGEEARAALMDAVHASMRQAGVIGSDGVFNPKAFDSWRRGHQWAIGRLNRAMPEVGRGFESAAKAARAMADAQAARAEAQKAIGRSALGRIAKIENPADLGAHVGALMANGKAGEMGKLYRLVQRDPVAVEALHRAIAEHITSTLTNGRGGLKSDKFAQFVRERAPQMRAAGMSEEQIGVLRRIAKDWEVTTKPINAGVGSDTAAKLTPLHRRGEEPIPFLHMLARTGIMAGGASGRVDAMLGAAGAEGILSLVSKRMTANKMKVDDLIVQAMLHPKEIGLPLLQKFPANPTPKAYENWANRLGSVISRAAYFQAFGPEKELSDGQ